MIPMNMFKKNGGFTLVELIVVIAILAILAGIAIPAYSGYVAKAEKTKDTAKLEAIQTAALSAASLNGANGVVVIKTTNDTVTNVILDADTDTTVYDSAVTTDKSSIQTDFETFFAGNDYKLSLAEHKNATIQETNGEWVATPLS